MKTKRESVRSTPASQDNLDAQIRELSEKIQSLSLSAHQELEEFWELMRTLKEWIERRRYVVVSLECSPYPAVPLWIDPSPQRPNVSPECISLADRAMSMA
jgi:hypothetical protein